MKRFRFKFQAIAALRGLDEMRTRQTFAAATRALREAERLQQEQAARTEGVRQDLLESRRDPFHAEAQVSALGALRAENVHLRETETRLTASRGEHQRQLSAWQRARLQVRLYERLEERARRAHWAECLKLEQRELEELAGSGRREGPPDEHP